MRKKAGKPLYDWGLKEETSESQLDRDPLIQRYGVNLNYQQQMKHEIKTACFFEKAIMSPETPLSLRVSRISELKSSP